MLIYTEFYMRIDLCAILLKLYVFSNSSYRLHVV
uniref:Uncharacterized protein n=1 Tax=Anguilla anguilla TaxID=7936 RepID=A0A0E9UAG9_ANGAN